MVYTHAVCCLVLHLWLDSREMHWNGETRIKKCWFTVQFPDTSLCHQLNSPWGNSKQWEQRQHWLLIFCQVAWERCVCVCVCVSISFSFLIWFETNSSTSYSMHLAKGRETPPAGFHSKMEVQIHSNQTETVQQDTGSVTAFFYDVNINCSKFVKILNTLCLWLFTVFICALIHQ